MCLNPSFVTTKMLLLLSVLMLYTIKMSNSTSVGILHNNQVSTNQFLKILSWNIYMLPYIGWMNNNTKRAEVIAMILKNENYDILVFQEAFDSSCRNRILKHLFYDYPFQYGPVNSERNYFETNSGLWVLSKIPLKIVQSIEFEEEKSFDAISRKGAVLFQGKYNENDFQLLATHLQADVFNYVRKSQEKQLVTQLLHPYAKKGIPQIICGDMNTSSKDLQDYYYMIFTCKCENSLYFSTHAVSYNELENKLAAKKTPRPRSLDYILLRKTEGFITIKRRLRVFKGLEISGLFDLSDHYAIEAEVQL